MEYSFECKVRKFSKRTIGNYVKLLNYLANYMSENFGITTVERVRPCLTLLQLLYLLTFTYSEGML